jgi:hypothetical protein
MGVCLTGWASFFVRAELALLLKPKIAEKAKENQVERKGNQAGASPQNSVKTWPKSPEYLTTLSTELRGRRYNRVKKPVPNPEGSNQHNEVKAQNGPHPNTAESLTRLACRAGGGIIVLRSLSVVMDQTNIASKWIKMIHLLMLSILRQGIKMIPCLKPLKA